MSESSQGLLDFVADQTAGALRDAADMFRQRDPGFIKDGTPDSIPAKIVQAAARQACRRYADDASSVRPYARWKAEAACRPYLDDIGYGTPGSAVQPFTGGQCPGVFYRAIGRLKWSIFIGSTGGTSNPDEEAATEFILKGPVTGQRAIYSNPGTVGPRDFIVEFDTADGPVGAFFRTNPISTNSVNNARFVGTLEPVTGTPTDCGSPAPVIVDPVPPPAPGPRYEPFSPSPDINIDIGVEVNTDGTINIDIGPDSVTIDPWAEPGADGPSDGPPPGDVGSPGGTEGTGDGGEVEGEAPPGSVLVGLKIGVIGLPERPNEYAPGVYRGVAYIYMGTATGLDQDYAGSMLSDGQFVFAEKDNLTHWRVRANNEYNLNVTPYYREVEES